jgi:hypothetical protein
VVEWWSGGVVERVEWWSGGAVERWSGGAVERWSGWSDGAVEWVEWVERRSSGAVDVSVRRRRGGWVGGVDEDFSLAPKSLALKVLPWQRLPQRPTIPK